MLGQTEVKAQTMLLEMRVAEVEDAVPQLAEHLQEIDDTWGGTPPCPAAAAASSLSRVVCSLCRQARRVWRPPGGDEHRPDHAGDGVRGRLVTARVKGSPNEI